MDIATLTKSLQSLWLPDLGFYWETKLSGCTFFLVCGVGFTENKDNLFKLNTKDEYAQLYSLNIVINVAEAV